MRRRSGFGWLELIVGLALIALGVLTLLRPGLALTGLVAVYGAAALVMGIADIVLFVRLERFTGAGSAVALVTGILSVMCGVMLLVYPGAGVWVVALLFPVWFLAHCVFRLSHLGLVRAAAGRGVAGLTLVLNLAGLVLGVLMLLSPVFTLLSVGLVIGVYVLLLGVDCVVLALSGMGSRR